MKYSLLLAMLVCTFSYGASTGSLKVGDTVKLNGPGRVCNTRNQAEQTLDMAIAQKSGGHPNWHSQGLGYDISVVCRDILNPDTQKATVVWADKNDLLFVKVKFQPYPSNMDQFTYWAPQEFIEKTK